MEEDMTIKELRELIKDYPDEMLVVLSKDSEGNCFSPLADHSDQYVYVPDSTWSGEIHGEPERDEYGEDEYQEELKYFNEAKEKHGVCLVLWPTN